MYKGCLYIYYMYDIYLILIVRKYSDNNCWEWALEVLAFVLLFFCLCQKKVVFKTNVRALYCNNNK